MKKLLISCLVLTMLFCMVGCGSATEESNDNGGDTAQPIKAVGESFSTGDFTYTLDDFQFVQSVTMGDYAYNTKNIANSGNLDGDVIAYFHFTIQNTGSKAINIDIKKPALTAGDIVYDGGMNGVSKYYCITTDDNSGTISPLETKEYNYCIFNIPDAMMSQGNLQVKLDINGVECIYNVG